MGVTKKEINTELSIKRLNQHSLKLRMIGRTPLYFNSMSAKAQRDLLIGAKKKTVSQGKEKKRGLLKWIIILSTILVIQ